LGYVRAIVHTIYAEKLITAAKLIKKSFPAKQSLQKSKKASSGQTSHQADPNTIFW
jgi:hypothetical protein